MQKSPRIAEISATVIVDYFFTFTLYSDTDVMHSVRWYVNYRYWHCTQ